MAAYEIRITSAAVKELEALPRKRDRQAVVRRMLALAEEPRPPGYVKLSDQVELYRVRQGQYRILYTIDKGRLVVIVIGIADRKEADRKSRLTRSRLRTRPLGQIADS